MVAILLGDFFNAVSHPLHITLVELRKNRRNVFFRIRLPPIYYQLKQTFSYEVVPPAPKFKLFVSIDFLALYGLVDSLAILVTESGLKPF